MGRHEAFHGGDQRRQLVVAGADGAGQDLRVAAPDAGVGVGQAQPVQRRRDGRRRHQRRFHAHVLRF